MQKGYMSKSLPSRPNLEQLKTQAKDLHKQFRSGQPEAVARVKELLPDRAGHSANGNAMPFRRHEAQLAIAREYGFASWTQLKERVETTLMENVEPLELLQRAFHENDARS